MLSAPTDTLAYHLARPLTTSRPLADVPCSAVAARLTMFMAKDQTPAVVPEHAALWFYLLNHAMGEIRTRRAPLEPLGEYLPAVRDYYARVSPLAARTFYYLLLICMREARHVKKGKGFEGALADKFGASVADYLTVIPDNPNQAQVVFASNPPPYALGVLAKALQFTFYQGSFAGGYGGMAWGAIADCLEAYVSGKYTAEMMMDTAWTLSHNNGPIFNKGVFFSMYNGPAVLRILDVQRSGQIPQAILHDSWLAEKGEFYVTADMRGAAKALARMFPALDKPVDWYLVEALGAKGSYAGEKAAQNPAATAAAKEAAKAAQLEKQQAAQEAAKHQFVVMPGLTLTKSTIVRQAA